MSLVSNLFLLFVAVSECACLLYCAAQISVAGFVMFQLYILSGRWRPLRGLYPVFHIGYLGDCTCS